MPATIEFSELFFHVAESMLELIRDVEIAEVVGANVLQHLNAFVDLRASATVAVLLTALHAQLGQHVFQVP